MNLESASKKLLSQIVSSDSGVDVGDLKGPQQTMARLLVEKGLVTVNPIGFFGPRFVATQEGRMIDKADRGAGWTSGGNQPSAQH